MDPIIGADTEAERDAATMRGLRILWRYVLPGFIIFALVWWGVRWLLVPLLVGCAVAFLAWRFQNVPIVRVALDLTWGAAVRVWDWAMISLSNMKRAAPERQTPTFARAAYAPPPPAAAPQAFVGTIAAGASFLSGIPSWLMIGGLVLASISGAFVAGRLLGHGEGVRDEREATQAQISAQAIVVAELQNDLNEARHARAQQHERVVERTRTIVVRATEELANAQDLDALDVAHAAAVRELREQAASAHREAIGPYLASVER